MLCMSNALIHARPCYIQWCLRRGGSWICKSTKAKRREVAADTPLAPDLLNLQANINTAGCIQELLFRRLSWQVQSFWRAATVKPTCVWWCMQHSVATACASQGVRFLQATVQ